MWWMRARRFLKTAGKEALMLAWACRQPATPIGVKLGALFVLLYTLSPIDLIPDFPIIGWVDDLAILALAIPFLLKHVPARVLAEAQVSVDQGLARFGLGRWAQ